MASFSKYVTKHHSCRGVGRASPSGTGWRGTGAGEGRPGGWLARGPGRGRERGARAGGGEAACREQPRAGPAREREPQPERGGEGRSQARPPPLPEEPRGRHSRPPPPRAHSHSTPGRRRRAARALPAPDGRPPHGALRPRVAAQPGPARHAEVRRRERGDINMQIPRD